MALRTEFSKRLDICPALLTRPQTGLVAGGALTHILGHEEVDKMAAEMLSAQQPLGSQGASAGGVLPPGGVYKGHICSGPCAQLLSSSPCFLLPLQSQPA